MAISYLQNTDSLPTTDPQLILTDSLINFVYEEIQAPDFSFGPYLNEAPTTHNHAETILEASGSSLNLAPTTHNNAKTVPDSVGSYLNMALTGHIIAETTQESVGSYLAPEINNNAETKNDSVGSYLNLVPTIHNNTETESDPIDSYLNLGPTTADNAETAPVQVGYYLNQVPPTHNNRDTRPEPVGVYLEPVPTTYNNSEPKPGTTQLPTSNSFPVAAPCIPFQYQDSYCLNAQNACHEKAEFTPSQFLQYNQVQHNQFSTASMTSQANVLYQTTGFPVIPGTDNVKEIMAPAFNSEIGFPVMPGTSNVQGMMVPEFKTEIGLPVMTSTGQMQGVMVPAFKPASTQTVSARVRRKKISDKTQELATLIPGGSRMNTAEMLLAAFKCVNFMKAQIGILSLMDSEEAREVPIMVEEYMRELLGSTNVQEYLSANGKCLVPIKMAMNWNKEMKSNNVVSRDLSSLIESIHNQDNALA